MVVLYTHPWYKIWEAREPEDGQDEQHRSAFPNSPAAPSTRGKMDPGQPWLAETAALRGGCDQGLADNEIIVSYLGFHLQPAFCVVFLHTLIKRYVSLNGINKSSLCICPCFL